MLSKVSTCPESMTRTRISGLFSLYSTQNERAPPPSAPPSERAVMRRMGRHQSRSTRRQWDSSLKMGTQQVWSQARPSKVEPPVSNPKVCEIHCPKSCRQQLTQGAVRVYAADNFHPQTTLCSLSHLHLQLLHGARTMAANPPSDFRLAAMRCTFWWF